MDLISARLWRPEIARQGFPAYADPAWGDTLHYLDNAATSQRLGVAVAAQASYESSPVGNAHRGAHPLAQKSSGVLESSRAAVASFLGVEPGAVAFTSGATESSNLLASSVAEGLSAGDVVYSSDLEHHSSYLPWREAAMSRGARFVSIPVLSTGELDLDWFEEHASLDKPLWICVTAMSNVTGSAPPIAWMSDVAKRANPLALVVVDAAQAVGHLPQSLPLWGGDFAFFSGHKVFAPAGVGVLAARSPALFDALTPTKLGGGMIRGFRENGEPRWAGGRVRFEAGSANVGAAAGLAAALGELSRWDMALMAAHEQGLGSWTARALSEIEGVRVLGGLFNHGVVSFHAEWAHAHDIGTALDARGVHIRVGHHCAIPLMKALGIAACSRISFGACSAESDAVAAVEAVLAAKRRFS